MTLEEKLAELPDDIKPLKDKIRASLLSYIKIIPSYASDTKLWQSKFRGLPYLPKGVEYPRGKREPLEDRYQDLAYMPKSWEDRDFPLTLLAQLNFAEIPPLAGYPEKGLLQFFISDGDLYGTGDYPPSSDPNYAENWFNNLKVQKNFRIIFYPEITEDESELVTDFSFLPEPGPLPIDEECCLAFERTEEFVPISDYRFEKLIGIKPYEDDEDGAPWHPDWHAEMFDAAGSKIGGYASFTQHDPRFGAPADENWLLLLQVDYTEGSEVDIMWGDSGVGNFFIRDTDLKNRDFSQVVYSWDCS